MMAVVMAVLADLRAQGLITLGVAVPVGMAVLVAREVEPIHPHLQRMVVMVVVEVGVVLAPAL
jgi:hypothetical protein